MADYYDDLIISDGLSGGRTWATYRRTPKGDLPPWVQRLSEVR